MRALNYILMYISQENKRGLICKSNISCRFFFILVFKDPPFQVTESGYQSFMLLIHAYFKNKGGPKKIQLEYNMLVLV